MRIVNRFKIHIKPLFGRLAITLFPSRAKAAEHNFGDASFGLLDRIIRGGLLRSGKQHDGISQLHRRFWAGTEGVKFALHHMDRFEAWFISENARVVDELENLIAGDQSRYLCLYEIGSGDGQVVRYLSNRLDSIGRFVGIDINERVTALNNQKFGDSKLKYICADAVDWICSNCGPRSVFFSNGGVLEYFSEKEILRLLKKIATECEPSVFAIVEPMAEDYDMASETASRPYGNEWSFAHNYRHLFTDQGFTIIYQRETRTGGNRWLLMVCSTGTRPPP